MASYTVPGVYIEEPTGLALSVQTGETAVPVFAYELSSKDEDVKKVFSDDKGGKSFSSWLDVVSAMTQSIPQDKKLVGDKAQQALLKMTEALEDEALYQSLRLYFTNGGGRCYVAPVDTLSALVPTLDDVTLLVQAGCDLSKFLVQVNSLCQTGKPYFALFDGPKTAITKVSDVTIQQDTYGLNETASAYAAVYYPWLKQKETDPDSNVWPPSGAVAGVYARVDRERGVWKAPANVALTGAVPAFKVSDEIDGACNAPATGGKSINVIREFRGTGPLIWGARTLKSDNGNWKYVPVRRLFSAAEKDIKTAMSAAIFEPNSQQTWASVRSAVESYLFGLWKQGALMGETPEQAYNVQIGLGVTMTQTDIDNGYLKIKVGLAVVRPAEFIILQLSQNVVAG